MEPQLQPEMSEIEKEKECVDGNGSESAAPLRITSPSHQQQQPYTPTADTMSNIASNIARNTTSNITASKTTDDSHDSKPAALTPIDRTQSNASSPSTINATTISLHPVPPVNVHIRNLSVALTPPTRKPAMLASLFSRNPSPPATPLPTSVPPPPVPPPTQPILTN
ncbi:hypothetical protein AOQ84DRAFT_391752, partial [Glonium stellatum]